MRSIFYILTGIVATLLWAGCSETCSDNKNALPLAGFYRVDSITEQVNVESMEVTGVGLTGDSVLSEASVTKDRVYLPFRIDSDVTRYAFIDKREGVELADTVTFEYTRTPVFTGAACGVSYVFGIRNITWQGVLIDSVICPKGFIDNLNEENLRIYLSEIVTEQ